MYLNLFTDKLALEITDESSFKYNLNPNFQECARRQCIIAYLRG